MVEAANRAGRTDEAGRGTRRSPDEHSPDEFGRTPLHYACADGDVPAVEELLAAGAGVGERDAAEFTPLHFAAQEQQPDVVRVLVRAGADLAATDRWGNTPLWRAVFTGHGRTDTAGVLIEAGADPDAQNRNGVSPRALADKIGNPL